MRSTRQTRLLRFAGAIVLCVIVAGCATVRNGGAPAPVYSYDDELVQLKSAFKTDGSITVVLQDPTEEKRNKFIDARLALDNIAYYQFIRDLGVDKQQLDAATETLLLGISIAGSATGVERAKTNLALLAASITGSKVILDKHFYFDKTVPALVSAMNARRKEILVQILGGRKQLITDYSPNQAISDLAAYHEAGTLLGAIDAVEVSAAAKDAEMDSKLHLLEVPTTEQIVDKRKLATALKPVLSQKTPENLATINAILAARTGSPSTFTDYDKARQSLLGQFRDDELANLAKWQDALTRAHVTIPQ